MPPTSLNAASNTTHSAIASQDSSRVTTTFSAHCTVHSAARNFNVKFCESRCKVGTIPYRTVRMISRVRAQRPGTGKWAFARWWALCREYMYIELQSRARVS